MRERVLKQYNLMSDLLTMRNEYSGLDELCGKVLPRVAEGLQIERVSVWQFEDLMNSITCRALYTLNDSSITSGQILTKRDFPAYFDFITTNQLMKADDALTHPATAEFTEAYLRPNNIVSMLDTLLGGAFDRPWGVLCLERVGDAPIPWETDEHNFAVTVSDYISIEIERFRQKEQSARLLHGQKMESLGRLAGGVAHDFNNILSVISNSCEILNTTLAQNGSEIDLKMMANVSRAIEKGSRLTKQLLAFTKDGVNREEILDVCEEIKQTQGMLESLLPKHIELRINAGTLPIKVKIDAGVLSQIIVNLVVNARDAISSAGAVTIEANPCKYPTTGFPHQESIKNRADWVRISVSDNGCGMSEEVRKKCIEPFFTTKPMGQGTGLGLSTIFGLVSQADGFIDIYSEPGKGSSFKIYLPLVEQPVDLPGAKKSADLNCNVVVVDDDEDILDTTTIILERCGCTVWPFSSPIKAVSFMGATNDRIDVLVSDIMMPEMNGLELAERIKQKDPSIDIILISGFTNQALADMNLDSSKFSFLNKPFSVKDLRSLVVNRPRATSKALAST